MRTKKIIDQQSNTFFWLLALFFIEMIDNYIYENIWMFTPIKGMIFILNPNLTSLSF